MNNVKYRWFQAYEKEKLEKLFGNQPTLEPIEQMTDRGWMIVVTSRLLILNK